MPWRLKPVEARVAASLLTSQQVPRGQLPVDAVLRLPHRECAISDAGSLRKIGVDALKFPVSLNR